MELPHGNIQVNLSFLGEEWLSVQVLRSYPGQSKQRFPWFFQFKNDHRYFRRLQVVREGNDEADDCPVLVKTLQLLPGEKRSNPSLCN